MSQTIRNVSQVPPHRVSHVFRRRAKRGVGSTLENGVSDEIKQARSEIARISRYSESYGLFPVVFEEAAKTIRSESTLEELNTLMDPMATLLFDTDGAVCFLDEKSRNYADFVGATNRIMTVYLTLNKQRVELLERQSPLQERRLPRLLPSGRAFKSVLDDRVFPPGEGAGKRLIVFTREHVDSALAADVKDRLAGYEFSPLSKPAQVTAVTIWMYNQKHGLHIADFKDDHGQRLLFGGHSMSLTDPSAGLRRSVAPK